jgi:hypothetical protein
MKTISFKISKVEAEKIGNIKMSHAKYMATLNVQLDKLSDNAKILANAIHTTLNNDDLSDLHVAGKSQRELLKEAGKTDAEIEKVISFYGDDSIDDPTIILWRWDCKRYNETPEQYFERQSKKIEFIGGTVLYIESGISQIYSFQEAAKIWDIDDSTLRKAVASGKFNSGEIRKTGRNYIVTKSAMERLYG